MNVLKDKSTKSADYISRYSNFPFYYHELDDKYLQGLGGQLSQDTAYMNVQITDVTTLDFLADKYYGRPDYWWVIADFNRIQDPFLKLFPRFTELKIPSISGIEFMEK